MDLSQVPSSLDGAALVAALTAFGLVVGVLTGLFGVGGGFMVTPLLAVLLAMPYPIAVGSSLSFIVGTSAAGVMRHARRGNVERKSMFTIAGGSMVGAVIGGMILDGLKQWMGGGDARGLTLTMHGLFIVTLLATAWTVARVRPRERGGLSLVQRLPLGPRIALPAAELTGVSLPGLIGLGLGVGIMTGLLGIGGGVLMMPILLLGVGLHTRQAVGTSLGIVLFASIAATVKHGLGGNVSLWVAMALLVGSSVGVQVGAWLCDILHADRIRRYFALLVLAVVAVVAADFIRELV